MKHIFVKKMTQNFSADHNFHEFAFCQQFHTNDTQQLQMYTRAHSACIYMVHSHTRNCSIRRSFSLALLSAFVFCSFIFSSLSFSDFKSLALADCKALYKCYRLHFCPNCQTIFFAHLFFLKLLLKLVSLLCYTCSILLASL